MRDSDQTHLCISQTSVLALDVCEFSQDCLLVDRNYLAHDEDRRLRSDHYIGFR